MKLDPQKRSLSSWVQCPVSITGVAWICLDREVYCNNFDKPTAKSTYNYYVCVHVPYTSFIAAVSFSNPRRSRYKCFITRVCMGTVYDSVFVSVSRHLLLFDFFSTYKTAVVLLPFFAESRFD
jgi:hypothetical protein